MRITVIAEASVEEDGYGSYTEYSQEGVVDLDDMLHVLGRATVASGWTYVNGLEARKDDDTYVGVEF